MYAPDAITLRTAASIRSDIRARWAWMSMKEMLISYALIVRDDGLRLGSAMGSRLHALPKKKSRNNDGEVAVQNVGSHIRGGDWTPGCRA